MSAGGGKEDKLKRLPYEIIAVKSIMIVLYLIQKK
jgi:hypothetical protein